MYKHKRTHTYVTVALSMRRVLLMEGEAAGMLGNNAKVQVSKFMAAVITVMSWRVLLFTHTQDGQTP